MMHLLLALLVIGLAGGGGALQAGTFGPVSLERDRVAAAERVAVPVIEREAVRIVSALRQQGPDDLPPPDWLAPGFFPLTVHAGPAPAARPPLPLRRGALHPVTPRAPPAG